MAYVLAVRVVAGSGASLRKNTAQDISKDRREEDETVRSNPEIRG
jgi:hypothetical protein